MKKVLAALAASGVLVAGGFATAAISSPSPATAQESTEDSTTETVERPERGAILQEVMDQLVADDVIDEDQAEAIIAALEAKRDELREQFGERRGFRGHHRGGLGIRDLLDDGVIDADELAALPEGHPLTDPEGPFAEYLDDGELTLEELETVHGELREQRSFGRGFGQGFGATDGEEAVTDA